MNIFRRFTSMVVDGAVKLSPNLFIRSIFRRHLELSVMKMNNRSSFDWNQASLPEKVDNFEDLSFLFWNCSLNRGILRLDFDEAAVLYSIIKSLQNPLVVEIGRFKGGSTLLLAVAVGPDGRLISIDLNPHNDDLLRKILNQMRLIDQVELIRGNSNEIVRADQYDCVFIDGDHSYEVAKRDHNKWGKLVRVGGYIIHHDMANARYLATQISELRRLRQDIISRQSSDIDLIKEVGSLTIFQRKSNSWTTV